MKRSNDRKARIVGVLALCICVVTFVLVLCLFLFVDSWWGTFAAVLAAVAGVAYLIYDVPALIRYNRAEREIWQEPESDIPTAITLTSEENTDVNYWDLEGKTSLLIGRSSDEVEADIDLTGTEFFSLISETHAVLNYTDKGWHLEDLGSRNGTSILRAGAGRPLELESGEPVPIRSGDTVFIAGETKLIIQ